MLRRPGSWRRRLLPRLHAKPGPETSNPEALLGGSWVVISGVIIKVSIVITHIKGLITLLITTHEPPSNPRGSGSRRTIGDRYRSLGLMGLGFRVYGVYGLGV